MKASAIFWALMVAFMWGLSPIIHKSFMTQAISRETIIVLGGAMYFSCLAVYSIIYRKRIAADIPRLNASFWLALAVASVVCGFLANLVYFIILKNNPSHIVSALISVSPVFALVLAAIFLRERVTVIAAAGVALVVCGIVCISIGSKERAVEEFYE